MEMEPLFEEQNSEPPDFEKTGINAENREE